MLNSDSSAILAVRKPDRTTEGEEKGCFEQVIFLLRHIDFNEVYS